MSLSANSVSYGSSKTPSSFTRPASDASESPDSLMASLLSMDMTLFMHILSSPSTSFISMSYKRLFLSLLFLPDRKSIILKTLSCFKASRE